MVEAEKCMSSSYRYYTWLLDELVLHIVHP